MKKLVSVISNNGEGIYFTSKTETLLSVEEKFNMPSRLIVVENGLTSLDIKSRALYVKSYDKTYTINPTDTVKNLQEKFGKSAETLYKINKINYFYPGQKIIISDE